VPSGPCLDAPKTASPEFRLEAAARGTQVLLTWIPSASSPLDVYAGTTQDFCGAVQVNVCSTTSQSALTGDLANGTTYYFWLVDSKANAVSNMAQATTSGAAPAAPAGLTRAPGNGQVILSRAAPSSLLGICSPGPPTGLSADPGNGQVGLSWAAPASDGGSPVTGYNVYRGTSPGGETGTPVNGSPVIATSYPVTGLTNGITYYFTVVAVNAAGPSPPSNEASAVPVTVPGAPAGLSAAPGNGQVALSWTAPASDGGSPVTGYLIYRGTSPGGETGTPVNGSPVTATSDTVTGLTNGTTYYFTVVAINAAGLSPPSDEASAALPPIGPTTGSPTTGPPTTGSPNTAPPFAAPTRLTATAGDTKVSLSWTAPASDGGSSVISYKVYVATVPGVQGAVASGSITGTDTTVTGLTDDTVYCFMVSAVNATGDESPLSTEVSAEPVEARVASVHLPSPTVPTQLIALLAAVAAMAAAGIFTLITRRRRIRSPARSGRQMAVAPDLRVVPDTSRPDALGVHNTGQEPTHTVRLEPRPGATTTTIKEGRP
jgi:YHS domain-containing protein